jgi:hypothetical protein
MGTIYANSESPRAVSHATKYFTEDLMNMTTYLFKGKRSVIPYKSQVRVSNVRLDGDRYFIADLSYGEIVVTERISMLDKPKLPKNRDNVMAIEKSQKAALGVAVAEAVAENGGRPIAIIIGRKKFSVTGVTDAVAGHKCDVILVNGMKHVIFLSLKAKTFQQFAGVCDKMHFERMRIAVSKFIIKRDMTIPGQKWLPPGYPAYHFGLNSDYSPDRDLIHKSMYGMDHGKKYGIDNVQAVLHGSSVGLKKISSGIYKFTADNIYSNARNNYMSEAVECKIMCEHRLGANNVDTGGRVGVYMATKRNTSIDINKALRKK